jgi:hypothetical protein
MAAAATWEGEFVHMPVGPQLSGIPSAPPDLPFHTQAIINTSSVIWIVEQSVLFSKQSKRIEQLEHQLEIQLFLGRVADRPYINWLGTWPRIPIFFTQTAITC